MHIQIGVAKIGKYATSQSGDTLELVERPHGGLSIVLADGQRSGKAAKNISNLVVHKTVALLAEGVRDGAAARAAHDYLYTVRGGKVSATLNIASLDMETKTLVISRNSHCPVIVQHSTDGQRILNTPCNPVGTRRNNKPAITELPLKMGMLAVMYTDGLPSAGQRTSTAMDIPDQVDQLYTAHQGKEGFAQAVADGLVAEALHLDQNRPIDDTSVVAIAVSEREIEDGVRRMSVELPVPPLLRP